MSSASKPQAAAERAASAQPARNRVHPFAETLQQFSTASGKQGLLHSLPVLARRWPQIARLPVSLRIVLESVLRNCDGHRITPAHVERLACWSPGGARRDEIAFVVARVVLQDFTGVPLLADLAAMRSAALRLGHDAKKIEPLVPVDLVIDHSIMVDHYGSKNALDLNMRLEFQRNRERYEFMKWGMQAFDNFGLVPPGFGIVHQINLEHLARGVHWSADGVCYPDTLVGTDSHTTMINALGVVAWGVGGIEAEAAMLGQPVYLLTPDVLGLELTGQLREGVTATDLVLTVTELLRRHKVVGKFVEFFGPGTRSLTLPDRATIANMAPEYGATMGFFPIDERTLDYFRGTGRKRRQIEAIEAWFRAQQLFGTPLAGQIDYSQVVSLDLGSVTPSLAGPRRPQDRIELGQVSRQFAELFSKPPAENGFNRPAQLLHQRVAVHSAAPAATAPPEDRPTPAGAAPALAEMQANRPSLASAHDGAVAALAAPPTQSGHNKSGLEPGLKPGLTLGHGDVLIAAITSCTNTSNPGVLLAAGLLAKKAVQAGLRVAPHIKTSLAPGSRVVTEYLKATGLLPYLEKLGFALAGYGCTTCIGNSGDLRPEINAAIADNDLVCAAVLSGNRNFEARIHPGLKANFLASPPLVVAYALAGTVLKDLMTEPVGRGKRGRPIWLGDIWPGSDEVQQLMRFAMNAKAFRANYAKVATDPGKLWKKIRGAVGSAYHWPASSYIAQPPFFADFAIENTATNAGNTGTAGQSDANALVLEGARIMALFGDSITTDHISPAGNIAPDSPAGQWLIAQGVAPLDFNSYGARRGHHEVMLRGSFANVRIKNLMLPPGPDGARAEGGLTLFQGAGERSGAQMSIFDAAMLYQAQHTPTVVFAGEEYGTGSSRDWAAKGTQLLGIKAVVARSFERIHRANLVGMGVLPLQFKPGDSWQSLALCGNELLDLHCDPALTPQSDALLTVRRADGSSTRHQLTLRMDTPIEVDYYRAGGILPYVLRQLLRG